MNHVVRAGVLGDLPVRDFLVSPGFAGVAALLAAIIAACAVLYAQRRAGKRSQQRLEQQEHVLAQARDDAEHAQAVAHCWERWQWVVDKVGVEPAVSEGATLGLGPAVALELLRGLLRDAETLGEDTLAKAVAIYQEQLLLVLAQQGGPVANLGSPETVKLPVAKPDYAKPDYAKPDYAKPDFVKPDHAKPDQRPASVSHRQPDPVPAPTTTADDDTPSAPAQESGGRRRRR